LGSLTGVSRSLGVPKSTLSRHLKQLEESLGVPLINRSTRAMTLTSEGQLLFERVVGSVNDLERATVELKSLYSKPIGIVTITATSSIAQDLLMPHLLSFMHLHPGVKIDLRPSESLQNLVQEGIDLAIRMGPLESSELLSRRLTEVERLLVATPSFLETVTLETLEDLSHTQCIVQSPEHSIWKFTNGKSIDVRWGFSAGNVSIARDAALKSCGVAQLPRFSIESDLKEGRLIPVLLDHPLPWIRATALYPNHTIPSVATQTLLNYLIEVFENTKEVVGEFPQGNDSKS